MRALVVYESMYGNTHLVAEAVGSGIGPATSVVSLHEATAADVAAADLVVVGGPTHAHSLTRESTRRAAADAAAKPGSGLAMDPDSYGDGLREWFGDLAPVSGTKYAAAFDTRMPGPPAFTGRASKGIAKRLRQHGFELAVDPQSFLVSRDNTLGADEVEHARRWGADLAGAMTARTSRAG
jgi:hypothetical protein